MGSQNVSTLGKVAWVGAGHLDCGDTHTDRRGQQAAM